MGIDPALFWANLFLYFLESKFKKQLISNGCSKAYIYIYYGVYYGVYLIKSNYLENHASFLDLDIKIEDF